MKVWCDGSCVGLSSGHPVIGWGAVWNGGVVVQQARIGGTNVNAEMLAIRDCLRNLYSYRRKLIMNEGEIEIISDSKTALQIINGYMNYPDEYNVDESENYALAADICDLLLQIKTKLHVKVSFAHVKGHQVELGNTFADFVATSASEQLYRREVLNET